MKSAITAFNKRPIVDKNHLYSLLINTYEKDKTFITQIFFIHLYVIIMIYKDEIIILALFISKLALQEKLSNIKLYIL